PGAERSYSYGRGARLHAYRDRILGSGARRAPAAPRDEADLGGLERAHASVAAADAAACPEAGAVRAAHAKRHQSSSAIEVEPDPVPADRALGQRLPRAIAVPPDTH